MTDLARLKDAPVPPARTEARSRALAAAELAFRQAPALDSLARKPQLSAWRRHAPLAASIAAVLVVAPAAFHYVSRQPAPVADPLSEVGRKAAVTYPHAAPGIQPPANAAAPAAPVSVETKTAVAPALAPAQAIAGASTRAASPQTATTDCPPGRACLVVQPGQLLERSRQAPTTMTAPPEARVGLAANAPATIQRSAKARTAPLGIGTPSYALVQSALNAGRLPAKADVRIGELVNAFAYAYPAPENSLVPFRPSVTVVRSPWNDATHLVHIAITKHRQSDAEVAWQVEFEPSTVASYRRVGEAARPPRTGTDATGARLIGPGHTVTAIYEITPVAGTPDPSQLTRPQLGVLDLRSRLPTEDIPTIALPIVAGPQPLDTVPVDVRFSIAVAGFGLLITGSADVASFSYDDVIALAQSAVGEDPFGQRAGFIDLVRRAKAARP